MFFLLQQSQELILTLLKKLFKQYFFIVINVFYPLGKPKLRGGAGWLLCYRAFAVDDHSCMPYASHMPQARLVNIPDCFD
jgi:hypothetical protein